MKKIISFEKKLEFPSMIGEIISISLDENLKFIDESNISGDIIIKGTYKRTEASRLEEDFEFKLPTEIMMTEKLDLESVSIKIEDFYYELQKDDTIICYIKVKVEGIEQIDMEEPPILEDIPQEVEEINFDEIERECDGNPIEEKDKEVEETKTEDKIKPSIFTTFTDTEENFKTYSVYIMRENDTLESVMSKYKITREILEEYNNLNDITLGSKIIIPASNE